MGVGPLATHPGPFRLRADDGYAKYATADGMSFRDPIDAEQLLKAADDLTNDSYWQRTNATVTEPSSGEFLVSVTAPGAFASVQQDLINWFPAWSKTVSLIIGVKAGTSTKATFSLYGTAGGNLLIAGVEKLSGPATAAVVDDRVELTGLSTTEYTYVIGKGYGLDMATATNFWVYIYPGEISAGTGDFTAGDSVYFTEPHLVLGDQAKPRPTQTDPDDWMMAWRPHNRVTKDGAARYSVNDSEGLVSLIGEPYAVGVGHASSWDITHSAGKWTAEFDWVATAGEGIFLYVDYDTTGLVDSTYIELRVSNGTSVIFRKEPGTGVENLYTDALTLGQRYRWRVIRDGDVLMVYQDDKLVLADGDVSDITQHTTGRINHTAPTSPLTFVLHSYPRKASGIIIAGGKASPAYDDPSIRLADPDLAAHTTPVSSAALFTVKQFDDGQNGQFGFDTNLSGNCLAPFWEYQGGELRIEELVSNVYPLDWNAGEEQTFMMMSRSDSYGHQFLRWDSGKQWIRHAVTDGTVVRASSIPAIVNYDMACYITTFALLDLSDIHEEEFCGVTDTKTNPADDAPITMDADFSSRTTFTYEAGKSVSFFFRIGSSGRAQDSLYWTASTSGNLILYKWVGGSRSQIGIVASQFSDGVSYQVDCVGDGSSIKVFLDDVLKIGVTETDNQTNTYGGEIDHSLDTNDIEITTHPHPALGGSKLGATDRLVCPQDDDETTMDADALLVFRNVTLPSSSYDSFDLRRVDSDNRVVPLFRSDGELEVQERVSGGWSVRINPGAGVLSDGEDAMLVFDGADGEAFVDGISVGSSSAFEVLTGTEVEMAESNGMVMDAIELWPLYVNLFKL
jgi:hypothetical protein